MLVYRKGYGGVGAMKNIEIFRIMDTTYEDNTSWIEYRVNDSFGYEIIDGEEQEHSKEQIGKVFNGIESINDMLANKKSINKCSDFLRTIIEECRQSDNEMWFVEYEDLEDIENKEEFILKLDDEIFELELGDYITINEDGVAITVYGGVITQFLF